MSDAYEYETYAFLKNMRKLKVHCLRKDTNAMFLEDYNYTCIYLYINI